MSGICVRAMQGKADSRGVSMRAREAPLGNSSGRETDESAAKPARTLQASPARFACSAGWGDKRRRGAHYRPATLLLLHAQSGRPLWTSRNHAALEFPGTHPTQFFRAPIRHGAAKSPAHAPNNLGNLLSL